MSIGSLAPATRLPEVGFKAPELLGESTGPILVVGPGSHFLSGVSYYTTALSRALADGSEVATLFMRKLCPRRLYPGAARVGKPLGELSLPDEVKVFDGL